MAQQAPALAVRYFLVDLVGGIVMFPLWWYTRGLSLVSKKAVDSVRNQARSLGLGVWVKNLFVPMFGATDIAGKAISLFLRVVMIAARFVAVGLWSVAIGLLFVAYLAALPMSVIGFLYHLSAFVLP